MSGYNERVPLILRDLSKITMIDELRLSLREMEMEKSNQKENFAFLWDIFQLGV